jgi:hypothetical protein
MARRFGWKQYKRWRKPRRECNSSRPTEPGPYVIFSQKTGNKIVITPDGDAVPPQSHEPGKLWGAPREQN